MPSQGDQIHISIGGDVSGQVAAGRGITQITGASPLSADEMKELKLALAAFRRELLVAAPLEQQDAAIEQAGQLEEAVLAPKPDVSRMARVREWVVEHIPDAAGAVTSVVLSPLVGKLVEAAGDAVVGEFNERFGKS